MPPIFRESNLDDTAPRLFAWLAVNEQDLGPIRHPVNLVRLVVEREPDEPAAPDVILVEHNEQEGQPGPREQGPRQQRLADAPFLVPFEQAARCLDRVGGQK